MEDGIAAMRLEYTRDVVRSIQMFVWTTTAGLQIAKMENCQTFQVATVTTPLVPDIAGTRLCNEIERVNLG